MRAAEAHEEAAARGFDYPLEQADAIDEALAAISRLQQIYDVPMDVEEEEIIVREWDEEREEFEESTMRPDT